MSRVGRKPITLPKGVEVRVAPQAIEVRGPKGALTVTVLPGITATANAGEVVVERSGDQRELRAAHGLIRALLANAATGVSAGWKRELEIVGIGYRAERRGQTVVLSLGHSHPIEFPIPKGIDIEVDAKANRITVVGIDRQQVGQVAAEIRGLRPPEPYKGKGVRYLGERIRTKAGKQGATS